MSKKERVTMLQKTWRTIVANACKQVIIQKANSQKTFFVTCDSLGEPKSPYQNIWVNMLHACCSILNPNINNINAQPSTLMNQVKGKLKENWEYVGYDLSYKEFKA
jgi:hypothetical protein